MRIITPYQPFFKNWNRKAGKKPSTKQLKIAQQMARPGTKNAMALAMALRENGASQPQIAMVTGAPHRNAIREVLLRRKATVKINVDNHGHKVFRLAVSA